MRARNLEGKTVLVTGAAKRLGRATALALARKGMNVLLHYHTSEAEAHKLREEVAAHGVKAWTLQADFADPNAYERLIQDAHATAGTLDALVNNASIFPRGTFARTDFADLTHTLQVNAWAPIALSHAFAEQAEEGAIVNLLDTKVLEHDPNRVAYHLSKQLLAVATRGVALELAPQVTVNAVAPGLILPPEGEGPAYLNHHARALPLQRHGESDDVARAVTFLLESPFITGQTIYVDGGRHLGASPYG